MNRFDAKYLANDLMREHGLFEKGWSFEFDRAIRRFGCCHYSTKTISISKHLVELNPEERVRNTILHEIAHALLPIHSKHGRDWKNLFLSIGGDGERCYNSAIVETPEAKYHGTCPNCSEIYTRNRLSRKYAYYCPTCYPQPQVSNNFLDVFLIEDKPKQAIIWRVKKK